MAKTATERQRERRALGFCCSCSDKALPGECRCQSCKDKMAIKARARYLTRKAAKVCPLCRDPEVSVEEGKTCCRPCLDRQAESTASRREDYKPRLQDLQKQIYEGRVASHVCVQCGKRPAEPDNVECGPCKKGRSDQQKRRGERRRAAVLAHYGTSCKCCGESQVEFLQIDHIDNRGNEHRREIGTGNLYKWLIENDYPAGFQTLCANCNWAKRINGICPHQQSTT